jgi:hypothetical protein
MTNVDDDVAAAAAACTGISDGTRLLLIIVRLDTWNRHMVEEEEGIQWSARLIPTACCNLSIRLTFPVVVI